MTGVMKGARRATSWHAATSRAWAARSRKRRNSRKPFTWSLAASMPLGDASGHGQCQRASGEHTTSVRRSRPKHATEDCGSSTSPVISITTKDGGTEGHDESDCLREYG